MGTTGISDPPPAEPSVLVTDFTASLSLRGDFDRATCPQFDGAAEAITAAGANRLVVDLAEVTFVDGGAITALVRARDLLRDRSVEPVAIRNPSPTFVRMLRVCGLDELCP